MKAAEASIVMPGKRRVNRRVNAPSGSIPGDGMVTSSTVPRRSPLADSIVARAVRRSRSTCRAGAISSLPAVLRTTPRPIRWNSGTPSSRSRLAIAWDSEGCAMCRCCAARPKPS